MANKDENGATTAQSTGVEQNTQNAQQVGNTENNAPILIEGYGAEDLVDYEDWRQRKVNQALKMMRSGYGKPILPGADYPQNISNMPKYLDEEIYGATKYFGNGYHTTDYKGFFDKDSDNYFGKLGYEITFNPEKRRPGDLIGRYEIDGTDENYFIPRMFAGKRKIFDYDDAGNPILTSADEYLGQSPKSTYRLRFVGTQNDIDKINAHNQAIRQDMHGANINAMPGLEYLDYADEPTVPETVDFLNKFPKRQ